MTRRSFTRTLALAGTGGLAGCAASDGAGRAGGAPASLPEAPPGPSLDALARAKGLRFGNAMGIAPSGARNVSRFHDAAYRALTARECSVLVAENETKWQQLRPDPRKAYEFGPADTMFSWAKQQGMALRGHTLLWVEPKWIPDWVNRFDFGAQPRAAAEKLLTEHISTTCRHFGRDIESWDVVNEAITPESGELRTSVFTQHIGGVEHIARCFELAREHAPHAQLVYNDFMSWGEGNAKHRAGVLKLLQALKARGAPVQALGLQAHIGVWSLPAAGPNATVAAEWRRFLDEAMGMGLDVLITEFDVNDRALPADIAERDAGVAAAARDWLDVTLASPRLNRFLCWGLADHYSWLQDFSPRADGKPKRVLPYDDQLRAKPLRGAIAAALRAMPARSPA